MKYKIRVLNPFTHGIKVKELRENIDKAGVNKPENNTLFNKTDFELLRKTKTNGFVINLIKKILRNSLRGKAENLSKCFSRQIRCTYCCVRQRGRKSCAS